jgi:adenosylmethionine-8-amino-7-oxononanoate aminotransferase
MDRSLSDSTSVFYRDPGHDYPVAVRGKGVYVYDANGKQYLDGSGGAAITCLGYCHPEVTDAIREQVGKLAFAHTVAFTNEPQEKLAARLAARFSDSDISEPGARVYFVSGGSEANETAMKLVRQYWVARGRDDKHLMISRKQSYHGNTLGALSLAGNPERSKVYAPLLQQWPKIEPCYAYRHQRQDESDEAYGRRSAAALENAILEHGAENIAAFFAEPVVGATMGAVPAVGPYFRKIREICDRHDILLVFDEVMAGWGRTGTWFAFEQEGVLPDIVTMAKGLGGGYQPIGAVITRGFIHDGIVEGSGSFPHGHTYVGHATAAAAGVAVERVIEQEKLLENVMKTGRFLRDALNEVFRDHPHVGDIRGRGLFLGIELVRDRETRAPIRAELGLPETIRRTAMHHGLICYPGGGTADGREGAHVLLAPPFIYKQSHVDELVSKLRRTFDDVSFL